MKYLAITAKSGTNYAGWFADPIIAIVTTDTREALPSKLAQVLASHLLENDTPAPKAQTLADVEPSSLEGSSEIETIWVEPEPISTVSLEIERAIKASGLNQSEVARRMGVSRSALSRLTNPFYKSHSWDSLQRVADALGMRLEAPKFVR
jgi:predicted XRE-type DNA-binding protein